VARRDLSPLLADRGSAHYQHRDIRRRQYQILQQLEVSALAAGSVIDIAEWTGTWLAEQ
jgi:hypothetical protein